MTVALASIAPTPAGAQATHDRALAAAGIVDQGQRLDAVLYRDAEPHDFAVDGIQRGVTGAGRGITGAPLGRATEVAVHQQAGVFLWLVEFDLLALDVVVALAGAHACPGHAEMRQFTHGNRCFIDKDPHDFLIGAPVRATHRVEEVHIRAVAFAHDAIGQRGLHAALCGTTVTAPRRNQRDDDDIVPGTGRFDGAAFTGQTAADDQYIGFQ